MFYKDTLTLLRQLMNTLIRLIKQDKEEKEGNEISMYSVLIDIAYNQTLPLAFLRKT
jgi:hypothetical protein